MNIRHKGIYHDRLDAPFVGSLISAISCDNNCPGCCNDPIKDGPISISTEKDIISDVLDYKFSEGIILGGLEWTCQYDELIALLDEATKYGLKLMLYTHYNYEELKKRYPHIFDYHGMYIKFGDYQRDNHTPGYSSYGIPLASDNQYILQI